MRHLARRKHRLPGSQPQSLLPHLKDNLPLHHVKPFFLCQMKMQPGSSRNKIVVLDKEDVIGLLRRSLERDSAETQRPGLAKHVLSRGHNVCLRRQVSSRFTSQDKGLRDRKRKDRDGRLQKAATLHGGLLTCRALC